MRRGGTARAAPARTGQRPARCATTTAPRASRGRGPIRRPPVRPLASPRLTSSLTEGGLRRGEPLARPPRGQDNGPPAARPLLRHGRAVVVDPLAGPCLLASRSPRLTSSLTEGGLRRGEPLARPPRGQDNGPPAARPLLRHGRAVVVDPLAGPPSISLSLLGLTSAPTGGGLRRGEPITLPPRKPRGATRASPPNAPKSLPCLLNDRETAGTDAPACPLDLRVNVAKCRRMSHFFIPPLGECRTLRAKKPHVFG